LEISKKSEKSQKLSQKFDPLFLDFKQKSHLQTPSTTIDAWTISERSNDHDFDLKVSSNRFVWS
jgi:hypothetical protein